VKQYRPVVEYVRKVSHLNDEEWKEEKRRQIGDCAGHLRLAQIGNRRNILHLDSIRLTVTTLGNPCNRLIPQPDITSDMSQKNMKEEI
jgi:hypothetical protein